jgi:hypothetical protein
VSVCLVCQAQAFNAFLCLPCWNLLAEDLRDLAGYQLDDRGQRMMPLALELDVVLSRQERRAKVAVMVTSTPERSLPVNLHAGRVRDRLAGVLASWAAYLGAPEGATVVDNARWLLAHEHDVRALHNIDELVTAVTDVIGQARRVIDNRSVRVYVGQCGAQVAETEHEAGFLCTAALWADSQYAMTRCTFCGTSWASMDRWEQYLALVRAERLGAATTLHLGPRRMASVLTSLGHPVSEGAIRKWAKLGKVACTGLDDRGRKTYLTGDVLSLIGSEVSLTG